jgi:tripartite ATP-independent transporter DctP family solute receptor
MSGVTRRLLLQASATGCTTFAILTRRSSAAEYVFRYANNNVATHPMNIRLREAVEQIREESAGRVEIQLFPNSQLGGDTDMLSQLRTGAIQMFNLSGLILATYVPVAAINGIGFAFRDYQQVWSAMDGALGTYVRGAIAKAGLYAFDKMWDNGYRQITSSTHPIVSPVDLRGFKIRVPVSPLWTSMFKSLGASPVSININEVYSALQTKIVEGQENPLSLINLFKFFEVQKYVSLTAHMWDGFWTLANMRAWAELPSELQQIVSSAINSAALKERRDLDELNHSMQSELTQKGMIFNQTDTEKFRDALRNAGFYAEWKQKYGSEAWTALEKHVGTLS